MELTRTEPPELATVPVVEAAAGALLEVSHHDGPAIRAGLRALDAAAHEALGGARSHDPDEGTGGDTAQGRGELVVLAAPDTEAVASAMEASGFEPRRDLVQLRRPLPLAPDLVEASRRLPLRPFEPGADDSAWLRVNRRAFDWHPEQGDWTHRDLADRMAEPWFDPEGFLVLDGPEGTMYGFCWTKVHPATDVDPELGEIFVIGVDPTAHGLGLGRALVVAGLEHLAERGLTTAMLYTEADNHAAMRLYRKLGFEEHEHTRWYHRTITPSSPT